MIRYNSIIYNILKCSWFFSLRYKLISRVVHICCTSQVTRRWFAFIQRGEKNTNLTLNRDALSKWILSLKIQWINIVFTRSSSSRHANLLRCFLFFLDFMVFISIFFHNNVYSSVVVRTILSLWQLPQGLYADLWPRSSSVAPDSVTSPTIGFSLIFSHLKYSHCFHVLPTAFSISHGPLFFRKLFY